MKKTARIFSILLLIMVSRESIGAEQGPYLLANVGYSSLTRKPSSGYLNKPRGSVLYGTGVGYTINRNFSSDIIITNRHRYRYRALSESENLSSLSVLLNGYYEFSNLQYFKPYLMIGAGLSSTKASDTKAGDDVVLGNTKNSFAWQLGVGGKYKITNNSFLDIGYRYVDLGNCSISKATTIAPNGTIGTGTIKRILRAHELSIGIVYKF